MYPFLITITFLSLMGMMTTTTVKQFIAHSTQDTLYSRFLKAEQEIESKQVRAMWSDLKAAHKDTLKSDPTPREKTKEKKPRGSSNRCSPLQIDFERPPNNSRFNFYLLLFEEGLELDKECSRYEIAARLLRHLYQRFSFFQEVPQAEYRILDALQRKKEGIADCTFPDDLSRISFEDADLQHVFTTMLKGGQTVDGHVIPSLLFYITFDRENPNGKHLTKNQKNINLLFASQELLAAVFHNSEVSSRFAVEQERIRNKILSYEKQRKESGKKELEKLTRTKLSDELKAIFETIITENNLKAEDFKQLFDFTLGKYGTILFVKDPITHFPRREKIHTAKLAV